MKKKNTLQPCGGTWCVDISKKANGCTGCKYKKVCDVKTLYQIHHQFKDGHTEFCAQKEISTPDEMNTFVQEVINRHPLPEGAMFMVCNEKSEHFVKTGQEVSHG